ncbi:MAG TPA: cytochrome c oxidase subunit II transmembrane domain-containing protein [Candidatus Dormibacteraeota bacterium]
MNLLAQACCVDTSPLHSGGAVDDRMQSIYTAVFWSSVVLGVLVAGLIVYAAFRFRRRRNAEEPRQFHGNTKLEIGWTLLPLVVFLSLFGFTAANMPFINDVPADTNSAAANFNGAPNVTVIGQQFSWTFDYGASSSGKRIQSFATLYVPEDTDIALNIVSTDPPCNTKVQPESGASDPEKGYAQAISKQGCGVNHSFYVPSLAGQMNAIPGQVNNLWINARQGSYYGQCTELCGVGHPQMTFTVVALPSNKFQSCVLGSPNGVITPSSPACTNGGGS